MNKNVVFKNSDRIQIPKKRQLPKLMACMTKNSLENLRNRALYNLEILDQKGIRRKKYPLHHCLIIEMREAGFTESAYYLRDLIYDNEQIIAEDEIGIVVDLKKNDKYLFEICHALQKAEKEREKQNTKQECLELLSLALSFAEKEKGILWLAEKLFLASIAVSSKFLLDGGRQKAVCKYFYAKFLLDKFQGAEPEEEAFVLLTEVRDAATGKSWLLYERSERDPKYKVIPTDTVFEASAIQLHRVLLSKSRMIRNDDVAKSERLARLAERRARDAHNRKMIAEAILEIGICQLMMNNLNNALKSFDKALQTYKEDCYIEGICRTKMHMAAVFQKMRDFDLAVKMLTEMGALAMKTGLRLQLGRALNLLGELHLHREQPELGTQHLSEAFSCFRGHLATLHDLCDEEISSLLISGLKTSDLDLLYQNAKTDKTIYVEEAEQARLTMAISAGQEIMSSFFNLIRKADVCTVAQLKISEWKLNGAGWWINRVHHELTPCTCSKHNRSVLHVLSARQSMGRSMSVKSMYSSFSLHYAELARVITLHDMKSLRSGLERRARLGSDEELEVEEEERWAEIQPAQKIEEVEKSASQISMTSSKESSFKKKDRVFIIESNIFYN